MKHFLIGASALAMLAACGADDAPKAKDTAAAVKSLDSLEIKDIKIADVKFKAKDYGQTTEALTALNLSENTNPIISFDKSSTSNGSAVFDGGQIKFPGGNAPDITFDKLTLDGLQMTDAGPAFDRLAFSDINLVHEDDGVNMKVGDISVVEPNAEASAFFVALLRGEEPEDIAPFSAWAFDKMSISGLDLTADNEDDGVVTASVGEVSLASMAEAITGQALLSNVKIGFDIPDGPDGQPVKGNLNLDKMSIANLQALVVDDIVEAGADPEDLAMVNSRLMEKYTSPIDQGFDQAILEGLTFNASGVNFELPRTATKIIRNKDGVAVAAASPKATFKLKADAEGGALGAQLAQGLSMLDYSDIEFSTSAKASYDPETKETRYSEYAVDMKDGFKLSFTGGLFNLLEVLKGSVGSSGAPNMDAFQNLKISDMELSLEDKSIVDRGFKLAASMQGMEPEQLKSMASGILAMGTMQAGQSGIDMEIVNQSVSALTKFIEDSGTLTIKLAPETPLDMSALEDPSQLTVEKLGFSATTK